MISTATSVPDGLRELLELSESEAAITREFFHQLGQRLRVRSEANQAIHAREEAIGRLETQVGELQRIVNEQDNRIASLSEALTKRAGEIASLNQAVAELDAQPPLGYAKKITRRGIAKLASVLKLGSRTP